MRVRKCRPEDVPRAFELAKSLDLDYPGMEADRLWVAEEAGEIVGLVALEKHPDCLELCGLGVDTRFRKKGLGKALVEALLANAPGDVHLATVIPGFAVWIESEGRYRLRFYPPIEMSGDIVEDTGRVQAAVERAIREYPDQWLWIHRRWKTRPPGEVGLYE